MTDVSDGQILLLIHNGVYPALMFTTASGYDLIEG